MHQNRTYIVTGAASGIGAETCRLLRAHGARVVGVDRNKTSEVDTFISADLSDATSIDDLVAALPEDADGFVNSAGLPPTAPAEAVMRVNLTGLIRLTQGMVGKLADGASIVNLASLAGLNWRDNLDQVRRALALRMEDDIAGFAADEALDADGRSYFLSKEALIVWTIQNRWTWRDRGITMNSVSPGPVATPILPDFVRTLGERVEKDMAVMDRPGEAPDIAPVISFLLSPGARWLRGTNIEVSGGMHAHVEAEAHGL